MNYFRLCLLISSVLISVLCFGQAPPKASDVQPSPRRDSKLEMSLTEKVGQLFILGFSGTMLSPDLKTHLEDIRPGGLLLFRKNLKTKRQLRELVQGLQSNSRTLLFVAVDQEGGIVNRVPTQPKLPSASWLGSRNSPELTEELGLALGRILLSYGINMNLAPVLDIGQSGKSFLGSRAYSSDPQVVAEVGVAFSRGLAAAGVIPTAKHFPGLGSVVGDPHRQSVQADSSYKELVSRDLVPFKRFLTIGPSAVMLSHGSYPAIDPSNTPATFSTKIVTDLLRTELGFEGLVITDDLLMEGAAREKDFDQRIVRALKAGSDQLLFAWSPKSQKQAQVAVLKALKDGELTEEWLDKKVVKILDVKKQLGEKQKARGLASDPELDFAQIVKKFEKLKSNVTH